MIGTLPQEYEKQESVIKNDTIERMSEPRVLFFAGDDILSNEKHFNPEWKAWGGIFLPHVKILKQSVNKGMLYRCKFTQLTTTMIGEPTAMLHPADRQNWQSSFTKSRFNPLTNQTEEVVTKGFTQVQMTSEENPHERTVDRTMNSTHIRFKARYPDQDVRLATRVNQPNGTHGVVEISALRNAPLSEVHEAQHFFFPQWIAIQKGEAELPQTIRELENHIQNRINAIPLDWSFEKKNKYRMIGQDMLKSCTEFRIGGEAYLKFIEDADRDAKVKGLAYPYPERASNFGALLEIKRKDDLISGESSAVDRLARAMETRESKDIELRERELALKEREIALREKELGGLGTTPSTVNIPVPEMGKTIVPMETSLTPEYGQFVCGRTKANGEPCNRTVDVEGSACFQHVEAIDAD